MHEDLREYSQQPLAADGLSGRLQNPATGDAVDSYLLSLSLRMREVEAQERMATALEQANELRRKGGSAGA